MSPQQLQLAAGAPYCALLEGGPHAGRIVKRVAEAEGPAERLPLSGDALYECQGTGAQGRLHYLHHTRLPAAGSSIGSTRAA